MNALREHWRFLIGAVAVLCLSGAVIAVATDTPAEIRLRTTLGLEAPCLPTTEDSPGWREEPSLPAPRDENRAVVLDGKVYLAGGTEKLLEYGKPSDVPGVKEYVRAQSVDELMRFDPATRRFEQLAPMPERLNHVSMVTHDGRIYVVGGLGDVLFGADVRREMWEYDPAADRWRDMPAMPTARGAASAGVIGDTLYVAGGVGENGRVLGTVEAFDFTTGRWERRADMPTAREHAAYAVADDRLYVLGGRTPANDAITVVEAYEPEADRWRRVAPLPQRAGSCRARGPRAHRVAAAPADAHQAPRPCRGLRSGPHLGLRRLALRPLRGVRHRRVLRRLPRGRRRLDYVGLRARSSVGERSLHTREVAG